MHANDSRAGIGARGSLSRGPRKRALGHLLSACSVLPRPFFVCSFLFSLPLRRRSLRSAFSSGGVLRGVHRAPSSSSPRERTRLICWTPRSVESCACFFLELLPTKARVSSPAFASLRAIISVLRIISGIVVQVIAVASRSLGQNCNSAV